MSPDPTPHRPARELPAPGLLLDLALDIARAAGSLLLQRPDDLGISTKSSPTDVVTAMDKASEALVAERIRAARPDDGLLGEEGTDDPGTTGLRWVVDPLDGTVNYTYRLPFWAVSIGIEQDGAAIAGVVHAPVLGWTFTATRGGGSYRNGERLSGSAVTSLGQVLLATGFSYVSERRREQGRWIAEVLPRVRDIRRHGSGALDLCMSATGLVDAYVEQGLSPWDLSAGALIAEEAGLTVTGLHGRPAGQDVVVSAPPAVHGELVALLEQVGAGGSGGTA
ncbi:MAG TPA: inositol monophosphatase family protein [Mycobacteriales bacterium]|nr:inositol monophosphatase family protein [Mycobacteriales bacterium]